MKTKTKIAIYARVSTKDQNPDSQLTDLRRYAQERGFGIYQEYIDRGVSGIKDSRPALDLLMEELERDIISERVKERTGQQ